MTNTHPESGRFLFMKKNSRAKGIFLIYVAAAAALISIFLIGAVKNVHNSFFLTKKLAGESKAFWAAEAGMNYAEYRLKKNIGWPFTTSESESTEFGDYRITETSENGGEGKLIHGKTEDGTSEFCIYFSKSLKTNDDYTTIVPAYFPSDPANINYCSFNSLNEKNLKSGTKQSDSDTPKFSNANVEISKSPGVRRVILTTPGIYIACDGRSGIYRSVLEKLMIADNSRLYGAGVYSGNDISVSLKGIGSSFGIAQTSNSKPDIYCKGKMSVNRDKGVDDNPRDYVFPCNIEDGTIYYGNNIDISDNAPAVGNSYSTRTSASSFNKSYGINIDKYSADKNLFPNLSWDQIKTSADNLSPVSCGTYASIWNKERGAYDLYYFDKEYYDSQSFTQDLSAPASDDLDDTETSNKTVNSEFSTKQKEVKDIHDRELAYWKEHKDDGYTTTDENGNSYFVSTYDGPSKEEIDKKETTEYLIEEYMGGKLVAESGKPNDNPDFTITTDVINGKKTPLIHVKRSIKANETLQSKSIAFVTMKENAKGTFSVFRDVPTDIKFGKKTTQLTTASTLSRYQYGEGSGVSVKKSGKFFLVTKTDMATIQCDGPIVVNGKLSGDGQLMSGDFIYFEAGSELNTNREEANTSCIAIYAKGSVKMGYATQDQDMVALTERVKLSAAGMTGYSEQEITYKLLNKKVAVTDADKTRISGKIPESSMSLLDLMRKCYGYTEREAELLVSRTVSRNVIREKIDDNLRQYSTYRYKMPEDIGNMSAILRQPSSFSGVIYTCGGFYANANGSDFNLNGALISYGADPGVQKTPGSAAGLSNTSLLGIKPGDIVVSNCSNFSVTYDSTDLEGFVNNYTGPKMVSLTTIYYNSIHSSNAEKTQQ